MVEFDRKYWEIERRYCAASVSVIWKMKMMFLRLGIPEVIMERSINQEDLKDF